ncbi:tetratricopeptide repeat protein [Prochlorococcus sp. MIT 0801]|uniref:tetratricopeptide repeat protein n=1 Tax=Prochlorococcus sp. MIT 0801 TaxID=1501269 RepID=UPI0004F7193B|nr:tetratricopeptide repeat protein [Prochlorococcus sp. MIT 0801]AIQ97401.1 Translation elongation factor P [Prochlorococcus sp. MIT 0801]
METDKNEELKTKKAAGETSKVKVFLVSQSSKGDKVSNTINPITLSNNLHTSNKEGLIHKAVKLHLKGNISEAVKHYQYCIKNGLIDYRVLTNYGVILNDIGKSKEAEILFRKAIDLDPTKENAYYNLANVFRSLNRLKDAEISIRKAIEIRPNFAEAHLSLANILRDFGQLNESEISLCRAIKLKPDFAEAHLNLANILKDLGKLDHAELAARKATSLKPDSAEYLFNLSRILEDLGKINEAKLSICRAIELKPDYAEAHNFLGNLLRETGEIDKALKSYSEAISFKPGFNSALMNRWQLFFDKGNFNLALNDADSCNSQISRVCALETLYALGRIDEIYDRIEKTANLDESNIRLAAFSSFIAAQENKYTANNFCPNPLSFLHINNLNFYKSNSKKYINEIIDELQGVKTIWEPKENTTRNGFHTPNNINLFSYSTKAISQLKSLILTELDEYYSKFMNHSCSFIQEWPSKKNLFAWHVILKKQGYQSAHIHESGWLSGVIYLKVVPPLGKDEGSIEFSLNSNNYSNLNSPQFTYQPKIGDIVLFPSSLHHRTIPFSTDSDRMVIAFDLMPNSKS